MCPRIGYHAFKAGTSGVAEIDNLTAPGLAFKLRQVNDRFAFGNLRASIGGQHMGTLVDFNFYDVHHTRQHESIRNRTCIRSRPG